MKKSILIITLLLLTTFAAVSCGKDGNDGRDGKDRERTPNAWVKNDKRAENNFSCIGCHAGKALDLADNSSMVNKIDIAAGAAPGDHTARDKYHGAPHFWSWANLGTCNESCHNRDTEDNNRMNEWLRLITEPSLISDNKIGVASCKGCHTIGEGHYGNKTVTVKNSSGVDLANTHATNASQACFDCHNDTTHPTLHARYFTETQGKAFKAGLHGNSSNNHYVDEAGDIDSSAYCGYCHSYNYSWKYNPLNGSRNVAEIREQIGDAPFEKMANTPLSCATCHEPHSGGLSKKATEQVDGGGKVIFSKEFVLCTSCHIVKLDYEPAAVDAGSGIAYNIRSQYYLDDSVYGFPLGSSARVAEAAAGQHFFSHSANAQGVRGLHYMGNFVKNHFATKQGKTMVTKIDGEKVVAVEAATGLNIDAAAKRACTNCHDPHKAARFAPGVVLANSGAALTQNMLSNIEKTYAQSAHAAYTKHQWNYANFYTNNTTTGRGCMPCHNGGEAVKFMEAVQDAWDYAKGPLRSIQRIKTNAGIGGASLGCVNCHDPDDAVNGPNVGGDGKKAQALTGKLRASDGNHAAIYPASSDGNFYLPAEQSFSASTSKLPLKVLEKQKGDRSLVCFTCHSGRSNVFIKKDNYPSGYGTYIHNDPGAGNVAGMLLPKIKDALFASGLEPRADLTNTPDYSTWSRHGSDAGVPNFSGDKFPKCTQCHNINKEGHSLAVYTDADGNPFIQDITDSKDINLDPAAAVFASAEKGCSCHGANGADMINNSKATAKGFAGLMVFYEDAMKIANVHLRWPGRGWNFADTNATATWTSDDRGLRKFAAALTYDVLMHDWGAYAHLGRGNLRQTIGEALAFIYQSKTNNTGAAADFFDWLRDGGDLLNGGGALSGLGLGSSGLDLLCPGGICDYDSWKSAVW
ncbi:MAG: hypothetical protein LBP51_01870 [Deferribacteraceae bacterium]|jgi:hypothetical protein|nr:hypothetical protein [Deferribacteraceae bacterium]